MIIIRIARYLVRSNLPMAPWPRRLGNFPIILIAIVLQYLWAVSILIDPGALYATGINIASRLLPREALIILLFTSASSAAASFSLRRKIDTVLALLPQQLGLFLSAIASIEAIWNGHYADGVERSHAFLLVDQCPLLLLSVFHMWAIILIYRFGEDAEEI